MNSFIASVMNVTVLIFFTKIRSLQNKSDLHILSLAIGDALIGLILSPISVLQVSDKTFGNCFVNGFGGFLGLLLAIATVTVMVIAYDRYIKIRELERYDIVMTKRRFLVLLLFPWFTPLLYIIAKLAGKEISVFTILVSIVFNCVTLVYSYKKITNALQERSHANVMVLHRQNVKSFRFIRLLVGIYLSLSSGAALYRILSAVDFYLSCSNGLIWYRKNKSVIMATARLMFQINSVCNPILYAKTFENERSI